MIRRIELLLHDLQAVLGQESSDRLLEAAAASAAIPDPHRALTDAENGRLEIMLAGWAEIALARLDHRLLSHAVIRHLNEALAAHEAGNGRLSITQIRLFQLAGEYLYRLAEERCVLQMTAMEKEVESV